MAEIMVNKPTKDNKWPRRKQMGRGSPRNKVVSPWEL